VFRVPSAAPADIQFEARYGRLYPGEGELPLRELLEAVPTDIPLSVEAPCLARAGRSSAERADEVARCTRRLLETVADRRVMA
jgi:hypothetical protein